MEKITINGVEYEADGVVIVLINEAEKNGHKGIETTQILQGNFSIESLIEVVGGVNKTVKQELARMVADDPIASLLVGLKLTQAMLARQNDSEDSEDNCKDCEETDCPEHPNNQPKSEAE